MRRFVIATLALLASADLLAQPAVLVYDDGRVHAHPGERSPERPVAGARVRDPEGSAFALSAADGSFLSSARTAACRSCISSFQSTSLSE